MHIAKHLIDREDDRLWLRAGGGGLAARGLDASAGGAGGPQLREAQQAHPLFGEP